MRDKIFLFIKQSWSKLVQEFNLKRSSLLKSYWSLPPESRSRIRFIAVCSSILMLGILIGLAVNINRPVQI